MLSVSVTYGGVIELLQPLVNRNFEMADFLADAAGAVLGVLVARVFRASPQTTAD